MKEILKTLQALQADVMEFDGYTLSSMVTSEHISASLHDHKNNRGIVANLDFVHKDYPEDNVTAITVFSDNVQSILLNQ